jgi:hypothetical protein
MSPRSFTSPRSGAATILAIVLAVVAVAGVLFFAAPPASAKGEKCVDPDTLQRTVEDGATITLKNGQIMVCHDGELEVWIPGVNDFRQLRDLNAGLCMGVWKGLQVSGAVLVQEPCRPADHSQWWSQMGNIAGYGLLANFHSGKCAAVARSSQQDGATLVLEPCTLDHDRLWRKTISGSAWTFINYHSGKAVSVPGSARTAGLRLQQWRDLGHSDQRWAILPLV